MTLSLVVLAAGMGSRYGGLKQLDPVGPSGETMLDYAVHDALRAGFGRVVFVIRRDFEAEFRARVGARYAGRVPVDYVFQALDVLPPGRSVPPGREKPWGTGHAVWCAREAVAGNFAVINADDFYGADAYRRLATFLREARGGQFAMVGYPLANTLSEHGAVSRGLTQVGPGGVLRTIVEQHGITPEQVGPGRPFDGSAPVSLNCWGFTPALFAGLGARLETFLAERGAEPKAEFYLPAAVAGMIAGGEAVVQVLPTTATWFGVTYREDKPRVQAALAALVAKGEYPTPLGA